MNGFWASRREGASGQQPARHGTPSTDNQPYTAKYERKGLSVSVIRHIGGRSKEHVRNEERLDRIYLNIPKSTGRNDHSQQSHKYKYDHDTIGTKSWKFQKLWMKSGSTNKWYHLVLSMKASASPSIATTQSRVTTPSQRNKKEDRKKPKRKSSRKHNRLLMNLMKAIKVCQQWKGSGSPNTTAKSKEGLHLLLILLLIKEAESGKWDRGYHECEWSEGRCTTSENNDDDCEKSNKQQTTKISTQKVKQPISKSQRKARRMCKRQCACPKWINSNSVA